MLHILAYGKYNMQNKCVTWCKNKTEMWRDIKSMWSSSGFNATNFVYQYAAIGTIGGEK